MSNLADQFGPDCKILIVDDLMSARKVMERILRPFGLANFEFANNGKVALELIAKGDIGLVISDWDMPEMDGISLLVEMRRIPEGEKVPFIMVTSSSDHESVAKAVKQGISTYIVKPFSGSVLTSKISQVLDVAY
jgi:two-component system chemotaxis response regulator CheY